MEEFTTTPKIIIFLLNPPSENEKRDSLSNPIP